jgi:hypothetical protein
MVLTAATSRADDRTPTDESYRTVEDLRATPLTLRIDFVDPSLERVKDDALRARLAREPKHCVSVTGVFDFSAHLASITESANLGLEEARRQFQIIDFQLQRQEREPDSGTGSEPPWMQCDINVLRDVINSSRAIVAPSGDPAPEEARDAVISAPLPSLRSGEYGDAASHPRLAEHEDEGETGTGASQLLLYRYLDFDVEPGQKYRYRVRWEFVAVPRDNVKPTRWTPWSEPTDWTVLSVGNSEDQSGPAN